MVMSGVFVMVASRAVLHYALVFRVAHWLLDTMSDSSPPRRVVRPAKS